MFLRGDIYILIPELILYAPILISLVLGMCWIFYTILHEVPMVWPATFGDSI
jgi:hypothetical protein